MQPVQKQVTQEIPFVQIVEHLYQLVKESKHLDIAGITERLQSSQQQQNQVSEHTHVETVARKTKYRFLQQDVSMKIQY